MDNSHKFSKPPSSLNISRKAHDGSGSSASTPSEEYKTPSLENMPIPGFDFGPREGEPEVPTRMQQLMYNAGFHQPIDNHGLTSGFRLEPISTNVVDAYPRSMRSASVTSSVKPGYSATMQHTGGHGSVINGNTSKAGTVVGSSLPQALTSKLLNENNIVPLMRSPPTVVRQTKKTTFAALPNQTTWLEETVQRESSLEREMKPAKDANLCPGNELSGIRQKLEERRRQIESEKKRMEMQWSKQRQQVGKEAFIQVVTKNQLGSTSQTDLRAHAGNEKPLFHRELSDGGLMPQKQQERKFVNSESLGDKIDDRKDLLHTSHSSTGSLESFSTKTGNQSVVQQLPTKTLVKTSVAGDISKDQRTADVIGRERVKADSIRKAEVTGSQKDLPTSHHSDISEYSTSLDRLNSSLTELQGEIMRLSLQQDQIKSLVGSDLDPTIQSSKSHQASASGSSSKEQFYLFPRNSIDSSRVMKPSPVPSTCGTTTYSMYGSTGSSIYRSPASSLYESTMSSASVSSPITKVYGSPMGTVSQAMAAMPMRDGTYPQGPGLMPQIYANPQGAYPQYYHSSHIPVIGSGGYAMPLSDSLPPSISSFPAHVSFGDRGALNYPAHGLNPYPGGWHVDEPIHASRDSLSTQKDATAAVDAMSADMNAMHFQPPDAAAAAVVSAGEVPGSNMKSKTPQTSLAAATSVPHYNLHQSDASSMIFPSLSASLSSPGSGTSSSPSGVTTTTKSPDIPTNQSDVEAEAAAQTPAASQVFFMALDSDFPRRPKPVLNTNYRKKESAQQDSSSSSSSVSVIASVDIGKLGEGPRAADVVTCDVTPSVGFVVGEDESCLNEILQQEVEKKRQKLAELHQKRQEELEQKKQKIEMEQQTKREALRLKQEKNEERKAKERARREEIFQNYLQKKADEDGSEEDAKLSTNVGNKRQATSKARAPRPKSQPPPSSASNINEEVSLFNMQNPDGGHLTTNRSGSPGSSEFSKSSERLNSLTPNLEQLQTRLGFSSLTPKIPAVNDRVPRFVSSNSDGGSDGGIAGNHLNDNYAGPKLFVKPSQKSNRHIIINAIKDCCLAGMVNQDAKNKVLEEISKSDSKHFVILFRDAGMQYRGLYTYNPDREDVFKIHGVGPNRLLDKMMEKFYKYNSGAKNFTEVTSTKHLSATIDAVAILGTLWQKKPTTTGQGKRPA